MNDFLSLNYEAPFRLDHVRYKTVRQFIVFYKALFFDSDKSESILLERNPNVNHAQELLIENVNEEEWARERVELSFVANFSKFSQNTHLGDQLLKISDETLKECEDGEILIQVKNQLRQNLEEFNKNLLTSP